MNDDFNTSLAITILFELISQINKNNDAQIVANLIYLAKSIGILNSNPQDFLQSGIAVDAVYIEEMIAKRKQARLDKNFALSDQIRDALLAKGVTLEDNKDGTIWRVQ
jgi:cysteinyl-tRNA synthetase